MKKLILLLILTVSVVKAQENPKFFTDMRDSTYKMVFLSDTLNIVVDDDEIFVTLDVHDKKLLMDIEFFGEEYYKHIIRLGAISLPDTIKTQIESFFEKAPEPCGVMRCKQKKFGYTQD